MSVTGPPDARLGQLSPLTLTNMLTMSMARQNLEVDSA